MAGLFDHFEKYDVQAIRAKGKAEAEEEAIAKTIRLAIKHSHTKEETIEDLMEVYELDEATAKEKVKLYWKKESDEVLKNH